jgi:hypothetical protein
MKIRSATGTIAIVLGLVIGGAALAAEKPSFDSIDANKDGTISKTEGAKVPGLDFAKADTNKDGVLSRAEFDAAVG